MVLAPRSLSDQVVLPFVHVESVQRWDVSVVAHLCALRVERLVGRISV